MWKQYHTIIMINVKAASVASSVFPFLPHLTSMQFLVLCQGFVQLTDILELRPCSATLLVVVRGSVLAFFSAPTTPCNKEAAPWIKHGNPVGDQRVMDFFCDIHSHKSYLSSKSIRSIFVEVERLLEKGWVAHRQPVLNIWLPTLSF